METSPSPLQDNQAGPLYIVGIGPGSPEMLTRRAEEVLLEASVIIGNDFYLDQIPLLLQDKEVIRSRMGKEVDRAQECIDLARTRSVAMVSGGDPGVYGMASIVLEVLSHSEISVPVEVVPGITAATAGAALLGSPLSGDFAVVSLSDLLTPHEVIRKRLVALFSVQIPVVLYNPKSRTRTEQLGEAITLAREYLPPETPVGIIRNAYRKDELKLISTLGTFGDIYDLVDMHSVVFIGGEETKIWKRGEDVKGIITPRGYHRKYLY
ncbi:MAG: precorrin-3B C(17)-methyltransferase [Methanospirillum sp.]|uniref:precorrin-3B C(17)-methyltransferase n=1 Tax=Methanospirillum sp. TaxID=45200 RepID=UPI00236DD41E|nr:precorrin-3B C(17)-methyltransferase [Methanospirillum sp.]MDD1729283.1 precorrin-3B C(17)-methyltransferase [Methanospirillum sp.]